MFLSLKSRKVKIGGPGKIVEIGKSFYKTKKMLVEFYLNVGGIRRNKKCFLVEVKDRSASTLIQAIKDNINQGTTIYSDQFQFCRSSNCCSHTKNRKVMGIPLVGQQET